MKTLFDPRGYSLAKRLCVLFLVATVAVGMIGCNDNDVDPPLDLEIRDWNDLNEVRNNLGGNHRLMNDLDSTSAGYQNLASATANEGKGWQPIGTLIRPFTGTFDGQGFEIRDLVINRPEEALVGLFSVTAEAAVIQNLKVVNAIVTGYTIAGGLVAANVGLVTNAGFSGNVTGQLSVGGVTGDNQGTVSNSYSTGFVSGAEENVGGLIGDNKGTVSDSYSSANATGEQFVGGLVGRVSSGTVDKSYATGNVTGEDYVGGLVGSAPLGAVSDSFWDEEASGVTESDGGTGKTTAEMMNIATFNDTATQGLDEQWDIVGVSAGVTNDAHIWNIVDGETYPFLSWQSAG